MCRRDRGKERWRRARYGTDARAGDTKRTWYESDTGVIGGTRSGALHAGREGQVHDRMGLVDFVDARIDEILTDASIAQNQSHLARQ